LVSFFPDFFILKTFPANFKLWITYFFYLLLFSWLLGIYFFLHVSINLVECWTSYIRDDLWEDEMKIFQCARNVSQCPQVANVITFTTIISVLKSARICVYVWVASSEEQMFLNTLKTILNIHQGKNKHINFILANPLCPLFLFLEQY
jgi:hypothetical protein